MDELRCITQKLVLREWYPSREDLSGSIFRLNNGRICGQTFA